MVSRQMAAERQVQVLVLNSAARRNILFELVHVYRSHRIAAIREAHQDWQAGQHMVEYEEEDSTRGQKLSCFVVCEMQPTGRKRGSNSASTSSCSNSHSQNTSPFMLATKL